MNKPAISIDDLLKYSIISEDEVPDGWYTRQQLQDRWQCGDRKVHRIVRAAVDNGDLEQRMYRVRLSDSIVRPTPHYGPLSD